MDDTIIKDGLIPANHELGFDQFILQEHINRIVIDSSLRSIVIEKNKNFYLINGANFRLEIDNISGEIIYWSYEDELITNAAIRPNFWRAPTDNDLGNGMQDWAKIWKDATEQIVSKLGNEPTQTDRGVKFGLSYDLPNNMARLTINYLLSNNGELIVDYDFLVLKDSLPNIPRLGMYVSLPNTFTQTSWYGNGPHETYWDRKTGAKIGIYKRAIKDQFHRYSRPQETGNITDLRWMSVSSNNLNLGVSTTDDNFLNGSVWPFNTSELDFVAGKNGGESASGLVPVTSKHGADIQIGEKVQWNIDHLQMGVGGDTSWGRLVHNKYTIPAKNYKYSFVIKPFKN